MTRRDSCADGPGGFSGALAIPVLFFSTQESLPECVQNEASFLVKNGP